MTIPVSATNPAQFDALAALFASALGVSDVAIDRYSSKVMLRFQFPGDIDPVMRRLYERGFSNSAAVALSIGVASPDGGGMDIHGLLARLRELRAVSNVSYDSGVVSATVAAASAAMRNVHDEIVSAGLVPVDAAARGRG